MMYLFMQKEEGSRKWLPSLASERQNIIASGTVPMVTALDVDFSYDRDPTMEEKAAFKYLGDMYFDWDSLTIEEAIAGFQELLINLKTKGVDLNMLRLWATGSKGFHVEMPMLMYMTKVPPTGIQGLPAIYSEIAHALMTDCLDLRIYSGGRGRQWRVPNVLREKHGTYKVQISVDEALKMTKELYAQVCSAPRHAIPTTPPAFNPELGLLYAQARDKMTATVAKRKKIKKPTELLAKFSGTWPDTFIGILAGVAIKPGIGWNYISLQLSASAVAFEISEQKLLEDAEGLIESHESDGNRYNTAAKRRRDLRDMYRYISTSGSFEFSVGGIMSMLLPEFKANADIALGEFVPDAPEPKAPPEPGAEPSTEPKVEVVEEDTGPIRINRQGIYARIEDEYRRICDLGLLNPVSFRKLDGDHIGYEVNVYVDGEGGQKKHLPMSALTARAPLNGWALTQGASMKGTDLQTSMLADIFRKKSKQAGDIVYALEREGVDLIVPPGAKSNSEYEIVWASTEKVVSMSDTKYRFYGAHSKDGYSHTDLMSAADLSLDDAEYIENLLGISTDNILSKILGWFCATPLTQLIRRELRQFPLLQVFGQAEAGKSATVELLNGMFYNTRMPRQLGSSLQTPFPIISAVATSASIPVVFEEMKPREMKAQIKDLLKSIFRSNYRAEGISRGSLGRDKAVKELTVIDYANAAPIVFVGESIEDQTAILARCVVVSMASADRYGKSEQFAFVAKDAYKMGRIGKLLSLCALSLNPKDVAAMVRGFNQQVIAAVPGETGDTSIRSKYNLAIAMTGLEYLRTALEGVFGERFNERLEQLKQAIIDNAESSIPRNMSEASKVLDVLSELSRVKDPFYQIVHGTDYTLSADGKTMDLKLKTAFARYMRWQTSMKAEVLFDSESAFIAGMANYNGTIKRACPDNTRLYDSAKAVVYRLSLEILSKEGVNSFGTLDQPMQQAAPRLAVV